MSIHRRGKYWYYDFTVNNCRYRGACGTTKKSLADEIETKLKTDRQRAAIFGETAIITFVSAADEWMKAGREALYLAPLISHFGEKPITQITPEHVRDAAIALYPTQSNATRNRQAIAPARAVINYAFARTTGQKFSVAEFGVDIVERPAATKEWIAEFMATAERLAEATKAQTLLPRSHGRVKQRMEAMALRFTRLGLLAAMMFTTAARQGQVRQLLWDDVDLAAGTAKFTTKKTGPNGPKTREGTADLPTWLVAGLANMHPRHPRLVFGYESRELLNADWDRVVTAMVAKGWPRLTSHEAGRHGFGTEIYVRQGVDLITAAKRGRWSSPKMLMDRYAHAKQSKDFADDAFGDMMKKKG